MSPKLAEDARLELAADRLGGNIDGHRVRIDYPDQGNGVHDLHVFPLPVPPR
jgi:hypothetical protein